MFLKCLMWLGVLFEPLSFSEIFLFSKLVFLVNLIFKFNLHLSGSGGVLSASLPMNSAKAERKKTFI